MAMKTISVGIGEARNELCKLVDEVASGKIRVLLTTHGRPKAQLISVAEGGVPWRVEEPDDPKRYGNLQSPVMEDWE